MRVFNYVLLTPKDPKLFSERHGWRKPLIELFGYRLVRWRPLYEDDDIEIIGNIRDELKMLDPKETPLLKLCSQRPTPKKKVVTASPKYN